MWNRNFIAVFALMKAVIHLFLPFSRGNSVCAFAPKPFTGATHQSITKRSDSVVDEFNISPLWRVGAADVNIPEKYMILYNFTVDNTNNDIVIDQESNNDKGDNKRVDALRVGRLKVAWDTLWSTERTFELELENIEAVMEFTNLKLSTSNWDELVDRDLYEFLMAEYDEKGNKYDEEGFFHFSSIDLSGNVTLHLASRPLGKSFGRFTLDMNTMPAATEFNKRIGARSDENLRLNNRKGITFAELSSMLKPYVDELIRAKIPAVFGSAE